ncbi:PhzF family phenazine biosynthesis protein [Halogranum rubrum]|nr:PhzF family phenazine biosynthesis protein [Halogranum rubrum]
MSSHRNRMHVVDVFAEEKYAGNQLAVVHDAADLSTEEMQAIIRETNFSEATFIESVEPRDGGYDVRIFDPAEEIPFAGHPTLGTAAVIREFVCEDRPDELTLNLGVGQIPVWVEEDAVDEQYWMRQIPPTFEDELDHETAARVLGLDARDVDEDFPIQFVSTGLPTLVVPLDSLDAAERASTNHGPYERDIVDPYGNVNILVFTTEAVDDTDLHVRVFSDSAGVPEDPATGSSNGCLAAYLVEHEYFGSRDIDVQVEQGYEMGRPSRLHLRATKENGDVDVRVGGRVVPVFEGHLL